LQYPLLENAKEPRLSRGRHLTDLVEEDGAAGGPLEFSGVSGNRSGERALFMTEELAFLQPLWNRRAVDVDEGPVGTQRGIVDGLGYELFPGAALAGDENRDLGLEHLFDLVIDLSHSCRRTDDAPQVVTVRELFLESRHLFFEAPMGQSVAHSGQQPLLIDRLGEIVVGAELRHFYGSLNVIVGGDHDDRQLRVTPADLLEHLDTVNLGHHEVEEDGIGRLAGTRQHLRAGRERVDLVPSLRDHEGEQFPDRRIVVDYPDHLLFSHSGLSLLESLAFAAQAHQRDIVV
jgi:hypothetical protein